MSCRVCWGSHGCDLEDGHEGPRHTCTDCSDFDELEPADEKGHIPGRARYTYGDGTMSDWLEVTGFRI